MLQIKNRKNVNLGVIFLLPAFVIAFAILRLVKTKAQGMTVEPIRLAVFSIVEVLCKYFHQIPL